MSALMLALCECFQAHTEEPAPIGETTNLSCSATFWNTKRFLVASMLNYKFLTKEDVCYFKCESRSNILSNTMKNERMIVSQKENNSPASKLKGMEYCDLLMNSEYNYEEFQRTTRRLRKMI